MTDANSQSNPGGENQGQGAEGNPDNNGGAGAADQQNQNNGNSQVDLKNLTPEQLAQVLENQKLWETPRLKGLLDTQRQFKKQQEDAQKQQDKDLEENNKFKELAEKKDGEVIELKKQIEQMTINQALTNKLAPLGVVDLEAAIALIDKTEVTVDENGSVSGVEKAIEALKSSKSYLFNEKGAGSVGSATNDNGAGTGGAAKFKRSQLKDTAFYNANRPEILKAAKAGLIEDDIS